MAGVFEPILNNAMSVRRWMKQEEGRPLMQALVDWKRTFENTLHKSSDPPAIYRAQGALEVINKILSLPNDL